MKDAEAALFLERSVLLQIAVALSSSASPCRLGAGERRRAASAVRGKADPLGHVRGERLDLRRWQPERG